MNRHQMQHTLLQWYEKNKRDLLWRKTNDPYKILVSEIMLQQTQVDRVIPKYSEFLEKFPTAESLAKAELSEVLKLWKGLGYNRRAKLLQDAAKKVTTELQGKWPDTYEGMHDIPGVGPYTANAVLSFAFNKGGPVFDANVRRVFYRLKGPKPDIDLQKEHEELFPKENSLVWNNAIMEFGALICQKGTPNCSRCVWREECRAWKSQEFEVPPATKQSKFQGSFRQYRAKVLHFIVENNGATEEEIVCNISIPKEHSLDQILKELVKEKMLRKEGTLYKC